MPPFIALVICIIFVAYLLKIEHKQNSSNSLALWLPTIWMCYVSSKPLAIWFQSGGASMESGSTLDRNFLLILLLLGLFVLIKKELSFAAFLRDNKCLVILLLYMLISILWSRIIIPSFKRWTREITAVVMALVLLTEQDSRQAMRSVLQRMVYIVIPFSLILINYFPEFGREYARWSGELMWIGVAQQKNSLGCLCSISAIYLLWVFYMRRINQEKKIPKEQAISEIILLLITLYLLKGPSGSNSVTSIVMLVIGIVVFIILIMFRNQNNIPVVPTTLILSITIIFGIVTFFVGGTNIGSITTQLGRDGTLTGRTDVWAMLVPIALKNPLLGSGFGGFWTTQVREIYSISGAHSGYLDTILEIGFIGLFLVILFVLSSCIKAINASRHDFYWGAIGVSFLFMSCVHNITESSFNSLTIPPTAIVLFLSISYANIFNTTSTIKNETIYTGQNDHG